MSRPSSLGTHARARRPPSASSTRVCWSQIRRPLPVCTHTRSSRGTCARSLASRSTQQAALALGTTLETLQGHRPEKSSHLRVGPPSISPLAAYPLNGQQGQHDPCIAPPPAICSNGAPLQRFPVGTLLPHGHAYPRALPGCGATSARGGGSDGLSCTLVVPTSSRRVPFVATVICSALVGHELQESGLRCRHRLPRSIYCSRAWHHPYDKQTFCHPGDLFRGSRESRPVSPSARSVIDELDLGHNRRYRGACSTSRSYQPIDETGELSSQ